MDLTFLYCSTSYLASSQRSTPGGVGERAVVEPVGVVLPSIEGLAQNVP